MVASRGKGQFSFGHGPLEVGCGPGVSSVPVHKWAAQIRPSGLEAKINRT